MKISHLLQPKKCFSSAAWIGNLYSCPICKRNIACGANGKIYLFPPFNRYPALAENIPAQLEWYFPESGWDDVHRFMKEVLSSIGDSDVEETDNIDQENTENE